MKKKYVKPMAFVEGFELSSHIATCVWDFNNNVDPEYCYAEYNSDKLGGDDLITLFNSGVYGCLLSDAPNTVAEDFCFFTGSDDFTLLHNS